MMIENGIPLPEPWRSIPEIEPLETWYMQAFEDLSSCRQIGFGVGQIPWTTLSVYIDREEIAEPDDFRYIIKAMDKVFLEYMAEQNETKK